VNNSGIPCESLCQPASIGLDISIAPLCSKPFRTESALAEMEVYRGIKLDSSGVQVRIRSFRLVYRYSERPAPVFFSATRSIFRRYQFPAWPALHKQGFVPLRGRCRTGLCSVSARGS
jgi:hypothetical protein